MEGRAYADEILSEIVGAFDALPTSGASGMTGVGIHFYRDEENVFRCDRKSPDCGSCGDK